MWSKDTLSRRKKTCLTIAEMITFGTNIINSFWSVTAWKVSKYGVFSVPYFPAFELNTGISPYSVRMRENTDQKKLRIWTPFTQWVSLIWYLKILHWKISAKSHTLEIWSRTKQNFLRKFAKLKMHWFDNNKSAEMFSRFCDYNKKKSEIIHYRDYKNFQKQA